MAFVDTHALPRNAYAARRAGVMPVQNRPADASETVRLSKAILTALIIAVNIAVIASVVPKASEAFSNVTGSVLSQISAPTK